MLQEVLPVAANAKTLVLGKTFFMMGGANLVDMKFTSILT